MFQPLFTLRLFFIYCSVAGAIRVFVQINKFLIQYVAGIPTHSAMQCIPTGLLVSLPLSILKQKLKMYSFLYIFVCIYNRKFVNYA